MSQGDNILLERFVRAGDADAFSELVQVHAGLVYGACLRVLTDHGRAADATQETFFQLLKHAEDITGSISAWLHRVATNKAIDIIRKDSSRKRREVQYVSERAISSDNWHEISPYVDEALVELDADISHVLTEHFLSGRSMTAIAASLGISQPAVSIKIKAGLAQLRGIFRRRGLLVASTVLSVMLTENTAQAAPAAVLTELGKMAIVSGASAAATSTASAGAAAGGIKAVAGAAIAVVKANVVTGVAIAAISTGVIVTYDQILKRADTASPSVTSTQQSDGGAAGSSGAASGDEPWWADSREGVKTEEAGTGSSTVVEGDDHTKQAQDTKQSSQESDDGSDTWQEAAPAAGMAMAGGAAASDPNDNTEKSKSTTTTQGGGGYYRTYYGGGGYGGSRRSSE